VRVKGVGLGVAGVLFAGLLLGHFKLSVDAHVLEFAREFGLILFVYTLGLQIGPGFFASLRARGLALNLWAAAVVVIGAAISVGWIVSGRLDVAAAVGLLGRDDEHAEPGGGAAGVEAGRRGRRARWCKGWPMRWRIPLASSGSF